MGMGRRVAGLLACVGMAAAGAELQPGMKAPLFEAQDQNGATVSLASYAGKSNVVLYFYPKDDTPGCTAEACSLRDGWQRIQDAGAVVLGVSADTVDSHGAFSAKYHLPFPILADPKGNLIRAYGVKMPILTIASRVTFIIDKGGTIRYILNKIDTANHDKQVLALLQTL
jgi:peroxiredoxin Q/BCP